MNVVKKIVNKLLECAKSLMSLIFLNKTKGEAKQVQNRKAEFSYSR
jgi:hypothetical protein